MRARERKARKVCLEELGMPLDSSVSYSWLAREIAAKDDKAIIDFDLSDKSASAAFLHSWVWKHEKRFN